AAQEIEGIRCIGPGARTMLTFDARGGDPLLAKSYTQQELVRRGILWNGFHTLSLAHDDAVVNQILDAYREVLPLVDEAARAGELARRLRGEPVEPVFRRVSNFTSKPAAHK